MDTVKSGRLPVSGGARWSLEVRAARTSKKDVEHSREVESDAVAREDVMSGWGRMVGKGDDEANVQTMF